MTVYRVSSGGHLGAPEVARILRDIGMKDVRVEEIHVEQTPFRIEEEDGYFLVVSDTWRAAVAWPNREAAEQHLRAVAAEWARQALQEGLAKILPFHRP